ncbi:carbohydrate kinase family protein [Micromonospora sp. HM5-17]|jgi:sugar/nucleoside kinase (ribokinase family)|uniref:carbohydrate kinase family protein n=1 Tax=Micromonospora sp. HM5-17 TaxID=2487710 RepID=UPI000F478A1C|nr:PfkB family carbohydrate kinase [Micromonospora sp. HM5-17]ROT32885.1 ribokinase [Micromonospora sp. HM5-17]
MNLPARRTGARPPRILVVGDIVTDVVAVLADRLAPGSDTPAGIRFAGGGQAANTAAWLAWRGHPVTLVGVVGTDDAGDARVAELTRAGVQCAVRRCPDAPTGTVIVLADDGERTMITERGANLRLTPDDIGRALAAAPDAGHLHLSAYPLLDAGSRTAGLAALAAARDRGLTTSVDAASAEPLRRLGPAAFLDWVREVDLLLANADEAAVLAGPGKPATQARRLAEVARNVVVKNGAAGSVWAERDGVLVESAARRVPVRDVTGAGDAFAAGLLSAWVTGRGPAEALRWAAELGAAAVAVVGARPDPGNPDGRG